MRSSALQSRFWLMAGQAAAPRIDRATRVAEDLARGIGPTPSQRVDRASGIDGVAGSTLPPWTNRASGLAQSPHEILGCEIEGASGVRFCWAGRTLRPGFRGKDSGSSEAEPEEEEDGCFPRGAHERLLSARRLAPVSMTAEPDLSGVNRARNRVDEPAIRAMVQH
jgi:hypothetical protein